MFTRVLRLLLFFIGTVTFFHQSSLLAEAKPEPCCQCAYLLTKEGDLPEVYLYGFGKGMCQGDTTCYGKEMFVFAFSCGEGTYDSLVYGMSRAGEDLGWFLFSDLNHDGTKEVFTFATSEDGTDGEFNWLEKDSHGKTVIRTMVLPYFIWFGDTAHYTIDSNVATFFIDTTVSGPVAGELNQLSVRYDQRSKTFVIDSL